MHKSSDKDVKKTLPIPPDGGWGWAVVFGSFMIHVIADGITYTFGIFFSQLLHDESFNAGAKASDTSWIASIMTGITYASGPIAGAFVNKWGCRPVCIVGSILASLGFILGYFATKLFHLYLSIGLLAGLGFGLMYLPSIVSVSLYFEKRRAFATGIAVCGSGVGTFALAPLLEILVNNYKWRLSFLVVAGIILLCIVFGLLFRPLSSSVQSQKEISLSTEDDQSPIDIFKSTSMKNGATSPFSVESSASDSKTNQSLIPSSPVKAEGDFIHSTTKKANKVGLAMSASHPVLPVVASKGLNSSIRRFSLRSTPIRRRSSPDALPVITSRKDIFYQGSLYNLVDVNVTHYQSPSDTSLPEPTKKKLCPKELRAALKEMLQFSILKDPVFLYFSISNFFTSICFNVPYVYIAEFAKKDTSTNEKDAAFLLSILGISNTLSRVILGYLSDKPWVNRLYLYNIALTLSGITTGLVSHTHNIGWLRAYSATYGVCAGVYVSLTSVILVDLLGLNKLTNAFGLVLLFQGIAATIGPPLVGLLVDHCGDYIGGFWLAGGSMAISGLMLFLIPLIQRNTKIKTSSDTKNYRINEDNIHS